MAYKNDLKGKKFNRLTVLECVGQKGRRRTMWRCICDCGNVVIVDGSHLKNGHTKSCGCYNKDRIGNLNKKTGKTNTRIHYVYLNMINRCNRKDSREYRLYGARGIKVCEEWLGEHGFENFYKWAIQTGYDINAKRGECTLDRIDVNGNYEPDNCRWVSQIIQCNNRRITRRVIVNGEEDTVANLSRKYNIDYDTLLRYSKGFPNIKHPELKIEVVSI